METAQVPAGTIVVGVDGSPSGEQALDWAAEQARLEHRPVTLFHGLSQGNSGWLNQPGLDRNGVLESMRSYGQSVLEKARETILKRAPDVPVGLVLHLVDPRVALLDLASEASMIVLGSRGRGPVRSLLLGSVGLTVSQHASCPVVVLRPHNVGTVRNGVLVGVDGSERSHAAVEFAYRLASSRDLPLTVLYCFWDVLSATTGDVDVPDDEEGLDAHRLVLSEAVSGMGEKFPDVRVQLKLNRGLADDCLVRASERMHIVVVGTHPKRHLSGLVYGDVGRGVLEHAHSVVVAVPEAVG